MLCTVSEYYLNISVEVLAITGKRHVSHWS